MTAPSTESLTIESIESAQERIEPHVRRTPTVELQNVPKGEGVYAKFENQQLTGAFKARGAVNSVLQMDPEERANGILTASTGNHAQGVSRAARVAGISATVVMPETAPEPKVANCKRMGSDVVLHGEEYEEAVEKAHEIEREEGLNYISSFDDVAVIAGAGTVGLEILESVPDPAVIAVPIGGGGIISGVATAIRARSPDTRVIGVQAAGASTVIPAIEKGEIVELDSVDTIADGIALKRIGSVPFELIRQRVDEFVTVTDEEIREAMETLAHYENQIVEPAGAVGFAALRSESIDHGTDEPAVAVITGGNVSMDLFRAVI
ncbi:MAG: threonine/serine dehydratase [Halodesulfurarchaeum sp.]